MDNLDNPQEHKLKKYWHLILGAIFLAGAPLWHFLVTPELTEIPTDFTYTANVNSYDNFYEATQEQYKGEQASVTTFKFEVIGEEDGALEIKNTFDVQTQAGEPIFSANRLYGIDAHTGMHVPGVGDRDREGYLFGPRMKGLSAQLPDKSDFNYWHINYNTPIKMTFINEDQLFGLPVYRYEGVFKADQTNELSGLPDVGETLGMNLDGIITLWIEPVTGYMVKYQDRATVYYYDLETNERIHPWNQFRNSYTDAAVSQKVFEVRFAKQKLLAIGSVIPILLVLMGLMFAIQKRMQHYLQLESFQMNSSKVRTWLLPIFVFMVTISLTFSIWYVLSGLIKQIEETEFQSEIEQINSLIVNRLEIYTNTLYGGRGLFEASDEVNRAEWKAYNESLEISQNFPGIQGFGYATWLKPSEIKSHIESIRAEGFKDYKVRPEGARPEYTAIIYLEPFDDRNQQAFGFDMYQEPTRRKAMSIARDTGETTMSGKVTLVQEIDEDVQSGFLIYTPYYDPSKPSNTVEERRNAIMGFIYSPFRMNNFIEGALRRKQIGNNELINIEIYDGVNKNNLNSERKMYGLAPTFKPLFVETKTIEYGKHAWTVVYSAHPNYGTDFLRTTVPKISLLSGLILSIILSFLTYITNTRRRSAMLLAESMTSDLRARTEENEDIKRKIEIANQELEKKAKELADKVEEVEQINKHMVDRELKMVELKKQMEDIKGNNKSDS